MKDFKHPLPCRGGGRPAEGNIGANQRTGEPRCPHAHSPQQHTRQMIIILIYPQLEDFQPFFQVHVEMISYVS